VLFAFSRTVDRIAGKTELQVTAGETGFNEEVLERVQGASTSAGSFRSSKPVVDSNLKGQGNLLVLGVDMTGDRTLRDYDLDSADEAVIDDPLVFPRAAGLDHSSEGVRRQEPYRPSAAALALGTVEGEKQFTVRGVMKSSG